MEIWTQPEAKASVFFTVRELLYLPTWKRLATPDDGLDERIWNELQRFALGWMDPLRARFGPIDVHCWYRPPAYNALPEIGGAPHSPHMCEGHWAACDFHVAGFSDEQGCATIRGALRPNLDAMAMRVENKYGPWVHCDNRPPFPGQPRFFIP